MNDDCTVKRLIERCQELLQRFPTERNVQRLWFTDKEKHLLLPRPWLAVNS